MCSSALTSAGTCEGRTAPSAAVSSAGCSRVRPEFARATGGHPVSPNAKRTPSCAAIVASQTSCGCSTIASRSPPSSSSANFGDSAAKRGSLCNSARIWPASARVSNSACGSRPALGLIIRLRTSSAVEAAITAGAVGVAGVANVADGEDVADVGNVADTLDAAGSATSPLNASYSPVCGPSPALISFSLNATSCPASTPRICRFARLVTSITPVACCSAASAIARAWAARSTPPGSLIRQMPPSSAATMRSKPGQAEGRAATGMTEEDEA